MRYRHAACVFSALTMVYGTAAQALPDAAANPADQNRVVAEKIADQSENDLTGYWQRGDGLVVHFTQQGSSVTSRQPKRSAYNDDPDIDFTATVHGYLIYGTHRGPFNRMVQKKCSIQIWVGMGLTLNQDQTELRGFRGDRIVDSKTCTAKNSDPVELLYSRRPADTPLQ